jgi:hypothetical protein
LLQRIAADQRQIAALRFNKMDLSRIDQPVDRRDREPVKIGGFFGREPMDRRSTVFTENLKSAAVTVHNRKVVPFDSDFHSSCFSRHIFLFIFGV